MNNKSKKNVLDCLEGFPEQKISSLLDYIEFLKNYNPDKDRERAVSNLDNPNEPIEAGP